MRSFLGYFAASLLPLLYNLIPNPVLFRWYWSHRETPVPADVAQRAELVGNVIPFFAQGTLLAVLWMLISHSRLTPRALGLTADDWESGVGFGVLAGLAWLGFYVVVLLAFRPSAERLARNWAVQVGLVYWLLLSASSAIVEEVWRAFCLVMLGEHGNAIAVGVTTVAFGLGHPMPLGRALSVMLFAIYAASLFLETRSLLVTVLAHAIVNIGVFVLIRLKTRSVV